MEDPVGIFRVLSIDRLPSAINSFMDRSLTSELNSDVAGYKRIQASLKAMETDSYLLRRTFHRALLLPRILHLQIR
jgi:hypothetical protein